MGVPDVTVQSVVVELGLKYQYYRTSILMAVEVAKTAHAVVVNIAGSYISC